MDTEGDLQPPSGDITATPSTPIPTPPTANINNSDPGSKDPPATEQQAPPSSQESSPPTKEATPLAEKGPDAQGDTPTPSPGDPATLTAAAHPGPGSAAPPGKRKEKGAPALPAIIPHPHSFYGPGGRSKSGSATLPPLTLDQVAIVTASQNKLPTSKVQAIVTRMGRHTHSSAGKRSRWYKGDAYVDNANYSWKNLGLFVDYQKQLYTPFGSVKASCKK